MIICFFLRCRDSFVPEEIDFYFSMMDKNNDDEVSLEDLQAGFAMFRYVILMSRVIKDLIPYLICFPQATVHCSSHVLRSP